MRDADVRRELRRRLLEEHAGDVETRIVEEMGIWSGSVRVDIAVINGELTGYELKSDRDTLTRLPQQADLYSRVFDRVILVVGARHAEKAIAAVPEWWGVLAAALNETGVALSEIRPAARNPSQDAYLMAQLLWKEEALRELEALGLARGWRGKPAKDIHTRLAEAVPLADLGERVRGCLKGRPGWLGQDMTGQLDVTVHAE